RGKPKLAPSEPLPAGKRSTLIDPGPKREPKVEKRTSLEPPSVEIGRPRILTTKLDPPPVDTRPRPVELSTPELDAAPAPEAPKAKSEKTKQAKGDRPSLDRAESRSRRPNLNFEQGGGDSASKEIDIAPLRGSASPSRSRPSDGLASAATPNRGDID